MCLNYDDLEDRDVDSKELEKIAKNPNTPQETLKQLADHQDFLIRWYVASNHNTPIEILEKLSKDKDADVRGGVARNPNTPRFILFKLNNDRGIYKLNNWVRWIM